MQWVEGFVLNEFVRDNLDKKPILQALGQIWLRMARRLRESYIAHCDLQHGNVMFVPGSSANSLAVKLIDYDGMCVPSLAGTKSGEVGHPAYQHPERLRTGAYDQEVDRFSLLSIAAALRCLAIGGRSLWERYDNGDNLLFRQADLQAPAQSPLFKELLAIRDLQAQTLVKELHRACQGTLAAVPLLTDLIAEEKPAGKVTKTQPASAAIAQQVAGAQGQDWNFSDNEPGALVVKKRRAAGKMPLWAWGTLGGAAAVLLVSVGLGAALALRKGSSENEGTPIAQNKPEIVPLKQTPKPPPDEDGQKPPPKDNPLIPGKGEKEPPPVVPVVPPDPPTPAPKQTAGWGPPINPQGDCKFKESDGKLTITLPNKGYDLAVEHNQMTAPRLLREVEGDFTAQVRVAADFSARHIKAAGLLVMGDAKTYVRLERSVMNMKSLGFWELRQDGRKMLPPGGNPSLSGAEIYLRMERRGDKVFGYHRQDGQEWTPLPPFTVELPRKVKIGVAAVALSEPFTASFDQFQLQQGQGEMVRIGNWLKPAEAVVAKPPTPAPKQSIAWDPPVDPDRDCKFGEDHGKLTITVPAKPHGLSLDGRIMNSPRLVSEVEGDFTAQVRVSGEFTPAPTSAKGEGSNFIGAGLLLWGDENTFFRLERAVLNGGPSPLTYVNWEAREEGKRRETNHGFPPLREAATYLRLQRRGKQILASHSEDGESWRSMKPLEIELPAKVKIGILAGSTTARPVAPTFDQFQLKQGQGQMVRIDKWLGPAQVIVVKPPAPVKPDPAPPPVAARLPVPDEAAQKKATEDIREIYQDDYKGDRPDDLSRKLLKRGRDNQEEPGRRFVSLREARDLAAQAGDFPSCFRVIDEMTKTFTVEEWQMKVAAVENAAKAARSRGASQAIHEMALSLLADAIQADDYDAAEHLVKPAEAAGAKVGMSPRKIQSLASEVNRLQKKYADLKPALAKLAAQPNDPEANRLLGSFLCFEKGDWERGLPRLALGNKPKLKDLAAKDRAAPKTAKEREAVGSGWWALAKQQQGPAKGIVQQRACYWYGLVLPDTVEETRKRLETGIRLHNKEYPAMVWGHLNISQATPSSGSLLLSKGKKEIVTHESYSGPIEITLLARTEKNSIRLYGGKGAYVIFNHEVNPEKLELGRPDGDQPYTGNKIRPPGQKLLPKTWYLLSWRITEEGMSVAINEREVFSEEHKNNLSGKYPIHVQSLDSEIEVLSFTVRPLKKKS
jgi:regulation of enolase protein 1 (concanavalin A-like superfamily)